MLFVGGVYVLEFAPLIGVPPEFELLVLLYHWYSFVELVPSETETLKSVGVAF